MDRYIKVRHRKLRLHMFLLLAVPLLAAMLIFVRGGAPKLMAERWTYRTDMAVELVCQNPELPNGCEVTSLTMLLLWAGVETDKLELYDLLPRLDFTNSGGMCYGPHPSMAYAGDAASTTGGWYCFEGPILEAGNAWLAGRASSLSVQQVSGLSRKELEEYLSAGIPLAVWVTLEYQPPRLSGNTVWRIPDGTVYIPYSNLHCVVIAGMDGNRYHIADPINGWTVVEANRFYRSFDAMGRRAVLVS